MTYAGTRVLITGGLGFVGSNIAIELVSRGARVTLVDAMLPLYGGNLFNIDPIRDDVAVNFADIRDQNAMNWIVRDQDYVFHVAGQVSHVDSITDPFSDVDINVVGTLSVVEACRRHNPEARIVFTGTRGQYGPSVEQPVDENAPTNPMGMYAITNLAAEKIVLMYNDVHALRGTCLRVTNTYGPRHHMKHNRYGVLNWFIRLAMDDEVIPLYGDGSIRRDFLFIDDLVDALLSCATSSVCVGEVFNVGCGTPTSFLDLAETITDVVGLGRYEFTEFTAERKALEPGDYWTNSDKLRAMIGWQPKTELADGIARTVDFYREHRDRYWVRGQAWTG